MKKICMLLLVCVLFGGCGCTPITVENPKLVRVLQLHGEYCYMEGQIDALKGENRVEAIRDDYKWIRNPYDEDENMFPVHNYYSEYRKELVKEESKTQ